MPILSKSSSDQDNRKHCTVLVLYNIIYYTKRVQYFFMYVKNLKNTTDTRYSRTSHTSSDRKLLRSIRYRVWRIAQVRGCEQVDNIYLFFYITTHTGITMTWRILQLIRECTHICIAARPPPPCSAGPDVMVRIFFFFQYRWCGVSRAANY